LTLSEIKSKTNIPDAEGIPLSKLFDRVSSMIGTVLCPAFWQLVNCHIWIGNKINALIGYCLS
jgi:hypothetical protein